MTAPPPYDEQALADPVLDPWFSAEHGHPDWRLSVVRAMASRMAAGETPADQVAEYGVPAEAAEAVLAWSRKWPGAW